MHSFSDFYLIVVIAGLGLFGATLLGVSIEDALRKD